MEATQHVTAVNGADVKMMALLPLGLAAAWLTPEASWRVAGQLIARFSVSRHRRLSDHIRTITEGKLLSMKPETAARQYLAHRPSAKLQMLRLHAPYVWKPRIRLEGLEHVEAALAGGKGVILWIAPFIFAQLLSKITLHRAGLAVGHLSREGHGYSTTRFGIRFLNPLVTRIEGRFVERIVIGAATRLRNPMRALQRRLAQNQPVSIMVGNQGSRTVDAPLFNGYVPIATGAPHIMARTGASLLPVFTVWRESEYVTHIDPALSPAGGGQPRDSAAEAIGEMGRRMESWVADWPDQFIWRRVRLKSQVAS